MTSELQKMIHGNLQTATDKIEHLEQSLADHKAMVGELYWAVRSNLTANHHEELLTKAKQLQENTK